MKLFMQVLAWTLMALSVGFATYLYPLPEKATEDLIAAGSESQGDAQRIDADTRAIVRQMFERGWWVNLALFTSGTVGAALWLLSLTRGRIWRAMALAAVTFFVSVFVIYIVPGRLFVPGRWISQMGSFYRLGAWAHLLPEVHRSISFLVAVGFLALAGLGPKAKE